MQQRIAISKNSYEHEIFFSSSYGCTVCTNPFAQPIITSFLPTSGVVGTTITISGNNFGQQLEKYLFGVYVYMCLRGL
jgi:hypothetical protein